MTETSIKIILNTIYEDNTKLYSLIQTDIETIENHLIYLLSNREWKTEYLKYKKSTQQKLYDLKIYRKYILSQRLYINQILGRIKAETILIKE